MNWAVRLLAAVVVLAVVQAGLDAARTSRWGPASDPARVVAAARQFESALNRSQEVCARRTEARRRVIAQLMAGELTLFEAAAWFRFLDANPPDCPNEFRPGPAGQSQEETLCRQVIGWVEGEYPREPNEEVPEACRRLQEQLAEHTARNGRVLLPEL